MLVNGDSALRGIRHPFATLTVSQERFSACLRPLFVTSQRLPSLIKPEELSPISVFSSRDNWALRKRLWNIKRAFMSLGKMLKGSGAQVLFFLILPAGDWDPQRRQHMDNLNGWLHSWCHDQGFGFYDLRCVFERLDMLLQDGTHLIKWGKSVLGRKLARL